MVSFSILSRFGPRRDRDSRRLGNMNYFVAWNHWHTVTIKDAQKRAGERIRELKKQLKECKKKTEELEAEAQRRAERKEIKHSD